ncbi:hypothetical protein [Niallia hominis]|uniref:Lipoprotein n=1 Tax=Niallia hominis TaxID=3133173 RepID=A0ABV1F184_9BACI
MKISKSSVTLLLITLLIGMSACSNSLDKVASSDKSEILSSTDESATESSLKPENNDADKETSAITNSQGKDNLERGITPDKNTLESAENEIREKKESQNKDDTIESKNPNNFMTKHYTKGKIEVEYPEISNGNSDKLNKINSVIAKDASYIFEKGSYEGATGEIKYDIPFISDEIVSITYQGLISKRSYAYPTYLFYSINVNIQTGEKVTLGDFVTIDDAFIQEFRQGEIISSSSSEEYNALKKYISDLSNEELLNSFLKADKIGSSNVFTYLTDDSIVVILDVIHVLGDFILVEIPKNNMNFK